MTFNDIRQYVLFICGICGLTGVLVLGLEEHWATYVLLLTVYVPMFLLLTRGIFLSAWRKGKTQAMKPSWLHVTKRF